MVSWREGEPKAEVGVPVAGRVVVPIRRPAVPGGVVPTAAPFDTVRASQDRTLMNHRKKHTAIQDIITQCVKIIFHPRQRGKPHTC